MLFRKSKLVPSISREVCEAETPRRCPKTGRRLETGNKYHWLIWACPILGLVSLIWFLIRVIPKPSRAIYPCQRVAAPLASGFVVWITGLVGSALAYRKARSFLRQSRYVVAGFCVAAGVMAMWLSLSATQEAPVAAAFVPGDPPNSPIGVAKGINPGRVVWVHDPGATGWDGQTGNWWDDENTNQDAVDMMVSKSIQTLTGETSDPNAWNALFRHFNQTRDLGDVGYQRGEKIAIKINMNQENSSGGNWSSSVGNPSPQTIYSVLKQLIDVVGVPGSAITIYDASRYIGNPIYDKVRSDPDPNFQAVNFVVRDNLAASGRLGAVYDTANPLHTKAGTAYLPTCVTGAKYLINMALLRPHSLFGITLCAKNHFGSTYFPTGGGWTPSPMHNYGQRTNLMGSYNCLVNLNGHRHLSGKTLLYLIDGLYPARNQSSEVIRWSTFGDDWFSSILASQDPLAIDSVGLDFLRNEPRCADVVGSPDNYLHEAALADNPPSGTSYDPEGDGTRLAGMGVHEHWNNSVERLYSRNLGTADGIELVVPSFATPDGPIENATTGIRYDRIRHAVSDADRGDKIVVSEGIYSESINFYGKNLTLSSADPNNPAVVAATIITGGNPAVTFSSGEDADSVLTGLTITGAETAVYCSGASPAIANCRIEYNTGAGIELHDGGNPLITNCEILANAGAGVNMQDKTLGRIPIYNSPVLANCVVAGNGLDGVSGGMPTITNCTIAENTGRGISGYALTVTNSIVYYNSLDSDSVQIEGQVAPAVTYSDVQGGWPGEGNIDAVPAFVELGFWDLNGTPEDPDDDFWVCGDYHLQSQAGRWDPDGQTWVQDAITSPCIDAGNPDSDWITEPSPNGGRVNMGACGGTPQASMSP
ncbi:MAG: right-handed parallel beta-helix repeat-containing protein [Planctomycetota bacterium]